MGRHHSLHTRIYKASNFKYFEAQTDPFRCGPVSIINAIRYTKPHFVIGSATRRVICVQCSAQQKHKDGFEGTKPENMTNAINKLWPSSICVTGSTNSLNLITNPKYNSFILLYVFKKYYHYIFMYKNGDTYFVQNDGENREKRIMKEDIKKNYLHDAIYPNFNYSLPQVWALQ